MREFGGICDVEIIDRPFELEGSVIDMEVAEIPSSKDIFKFGEKRKAPITIMDFLLGGLSCMTAALVTHPIDTIKTRLQLQDGRKKQYNGFVLGITTIYKQEGIKGLYGGVSASLLREATYSTIRMGLYGSFKQIYGSVTLGDKNADVGLVGKIVAGGMSGFVGALLSNPADLLKIRMQAGNGHRRLRDLAADVIQKEGIKGLYRGVSANVQRAIVLTATQLPSYDHTKHTLLSFNNKESILLHFVCSMVAGLCSATTTSPIDVIKTRLMSQLSSSNRRYTSTWDCFYKTVQGEGFGALYKGWFANWMRIGPHTIVTFVVLEQLRLIVGLQPV